MHRLSAPTDFRAPRASQVEVPAAPARRTSTARCCGSTWTGDVGRALVDRRRAGQRPLLARAGVGRRPHAAARRDRRHGPRRSQLLPWRAATGVWVDPSVRAVPDGITVALRRRRPRRPGGPGAAAVTGGTIELPDAPADLADALGRGRAVAWSEPLTIRTYEAGEPDRTRCTSIAASTRAPAGGCTRCRSSTRVADESAAARVAGDPPRERATCGSWCCPSSAGASTSGYDKIAGYDFFYRNNVIKPALVGLARPVDLAAASSSTGRSTTGPRPTCPSRPRSSTSDDGAVTVWCGDHDPFTRMSAHARRPAASGQLGGRARACGCTTARASARPSCGGRTSRPACTTTTSRSSPTDVRYVADHARRAAHGLPARGPALLRRRLPGAGRAARRAPTGSTGTATSRCRRRTWSSTPRGLLRRLRPRRRRRASCTGPTAACRPGQEAVDLGRRRRSATPGTPS